MARWALAAALAVMLSGCGTFENHFFIGPIPDDRDLVYGGVRRDLVQVQVCGQNAAHAKDLREASEAAGKGLLWLLVDLPLSTAADTLLLPFTTTVAVRRLTGTMPPDYLVRPATTAPDSPPAQKVPSTPSSH